MTSLFWLQLRALIWKNWIVLSKHPFVSPDGVGPLIIGGLVLNAFLAQHLEVFHFPDCLWHFSGGSPSIPEQTE